MPYYLKIFQYSLNVSDKVCNYVVKPLIKSVTTEGELIIMIIIAIYSLFIDVLTQKVVSFYRDRASAIIQQQSRKEKIHDKNKESNEAFDVKLI